MAKYVLEEMLRVRNFRKEKAEKNLNQARRLVEEGKENLKNAEKALEEYKVFMEKESDRLYKKIIMQKVKRGAVDELHYAVRLLKNKLVTHEQNIETAKDNLVKAEKNLEEKREALRDATRNVEKIQSHKEVWIKEANKEAELVQDKELEEFAKIKTEK
jgi:F0F1-type ATP synthase membrane subunit b/b'